MTRCFTSGTYAFDPYVKVMWVENIADVQAPTDTEILAGVDLHPAPYVLTDIIGWLVTTDRLRDGLWGPLELQRMGKQKVGESSLGFAADLSGVDIRSLWERGDVGNIVILPSGPYTFNPTAPIMVFPVRVSQISPVMELRTGGGATILVDFVIRGRRIGESVTVVGP